MAREKCPDEGGHQNPHEEKCFVVAMTQIYYGLLHSSICYIFLKCHFVLAWEIPDYFRQI